LEQNKTKQNKTKQNNNNNSIWNKEQFSEECKESDIVPMYNMGDKTDCSNYQGISLLSTSYRIYPIFFSQV
jgi:hypothetical protein